MDSRHHNWERLGGGMRGFITLAGGLALKPVRYTRIKRIAQRPRGCIPPRTGRGARSGIRLLIDRGMLVWIQSAVRNTV